MKKIKLPVIFFICSQLSSAAASDKNTVRMDELLKIPVPDIFEAEIQVSAATKTSTTIRQAPNTISTYDYPTIRQIGARKLSDILWIISGFQVQMSGNNRERAWIRGVQSEFDNKILLYIDNVPIRDVFGGFSVDEEIPIESIEKIEIIRGPGAALYGANAFSGVINITTYQAKKASNTRTTKNQIKGGIGEKNTQLGYFSLQHEITDDVAVVLEGKGFKTDGRQPDYDRTGQTNFRTANQDLNYLHLNLSALDGELQFNTTYSRFSNFRVDVPNPNESEQIHKNLRFSLNYKHQFENNLAIDLNLYHTNVSRIEYEKVFADVSGFTISSSNFTAKSSHSATQYVDETQLTGFYSALDYKPTKSNQFVVGFDIKREQLSNSHFINQMTGKIDSFIQDNHYDNIELIDYGFFIQDTQDIFSHSTQLTVGLRYDALQLFENQFSYRLGLTHAFNEQFYSKLLYGTAYRSPSFIEFARAPIGSQIPKVETMQTLETQLGYQTQNLSLILTGFYNRYNDLISRKNSFIDGSKTLADEVFGNVDDEETIGVELESKFSFLDNWTGFVNTSWSEAESKGQDEALPLLATWTAAAGITWQQNFNNLGDISLNNHIITYGKRKDWPIDIWDQGIKTRHAQRESGFNDGFTVWNTALHYKLPVSKSQVFDFDLSVHNLLDKKYYTQSLVPPSSTKPAYFDSPYQERQLRFSVSYSWQ